MARPDWTKVDEAVRITDLETGWYVQQPRWNRSWRWARRTARRHFRTMMKEARVG